jgi:hypothetical protein
VATVRVGCSGEGLWAGRTRRRVSGRTSRRLIAPLIDATSVRAGRRNALSAVVSIRARRADSAAVRFGLDELGATVSGR